MKNNDIEKLVADSGIDTISRYAILDIEFKSVRLLINSEDKSKIFNVLINHGWKEEKKIEKEVYLYGMDRFKYFKKNDVTLTICCQLACKSTLNGEWVPLDRKINIGVLSHNNLSKNGMVNLSPEDFLCYILAKCVYTEKNFSEYDIKRINDTFKLVDKAILMPKLEGVFFKFSDNILKLIELGKFNSIRDELWSFSEY